MCLLDVVDSHRPLDTESIVLGSSFFSCGEGTAKGWMCLEAERRQECSDVSARETFSIAWASI